jgi:hypothetical protein
VECGVAHDGLDFVGILILNVVNLDLHVEDCDFFLLLQGEELSWGRFTVFFSSWFCFTRSNYYGVREG